MLQLPLIRRDTDQFAAFLMLQFGNGLVREVLDGMAWLYQAEAGHFALATTDTTERRYYDTLCFVYGSDPRSFEGGLLSKAHAEGCARETPPVLAEFRAAILPYVDLDLMKRVQAKDWLKTDDPNSPAALVPEFPWPPPAASTSYVVPASLLQARSTIGQVVAIIISSLEQTGYVERSFYRTKTNGVALITRLERINDDGSPASGNERWSAGLSYQSTLDLVRFPRGLFYVERGRYRVIVFILDDMPFSQSSERISEADARAWLRTGVNVLPPELAERPYGAGNCTVLIYEFASEGNVARLVDSNLTGKQHLEKAGLLAGLEQSR
jgi:hypothetical protein